MIVKQEAAFHTKPERKLTKANSISSMKINISFLTFLYTNHKARWAMIIFIPILVMTIVTPLLPLQAPLETNVSEGLFPPSWEHPFGTDKLGRDIFSRTMAGISVSLIVGFSVAAIALLFGIVLGTISGL